jgi:hypothetical protein
MCFSFSCIIIIISGVVVLVVPGRIGREHENEREIRSLTSFYLILTTLAYLSSSSSSSCSWNKMAHTDWFRQLRMNSVGRNMHRSIILFHTTSLHLNNCSPFCPEHPCQFSSVSFFCANPLLFCSSSSRSQSCI